MGEIEAGNGAYGLRLSGLESSRHLLVPAPPDWPNLALDVEVGDGTAARDRVTDDEAELVLLTGGKVQMKREPMRAVYTVPRPLGADELIHPYLAVAATMAAYWLGRESFHAGAVVVEGGAWALVGDREVGKSSMLGWLSLHGHRVLCDDVLVVMGGSILAGPRAVDLRDDAARALGTGEPLGLVGARKRWRLMLAPVEPVVPLRGWIFLDWADEISMHAVRPRDRLIQLSRHRSIRLAPREPTTLISLAALPAWELRRPRDWVSLRSAADALLAAIGS
jgi:hypothetical protein